MNSRRIAFVVPRYAVRSAGGAEVLAKNVAEHLAGAGNKVSVFTTCARDHFTWANHFKPGRETINRVEVNRFPVDERAKDNDFAAIQERISHASKISRDEEETWIRGSVHSGPLYDSIGENRDRFDIFIFIPYLFGTTWAGSAVAPQKSVIIPCLHDEPYARLDIFREMFANVRGIIFNSEPERDLALRLFRISADKTGVGGMGFEPRERYRPERFRRKFGIKTPFIIYAGRREQGKNTPLLVEYFRLFKKHNRNELKLVLLGTGQVDISPELSNVVLDPGYVREDLKHDGYSAALALCQPSTNESLSIVIMEAWLAGTPSLVNADCAVTSYYCLNSNGGLLFRNYYDFEESILYLFEKETVREALASAGRRYVLKNLSWDSIIKRYEDAFVRIGL